MPSKVKYVTHTVGNKVYYFIGRKSLTQAEIDEMVEAINADVEQEKPAKDFVVTKELKNIFANDLKNGLEFCTTKYGATSDQIKGEAARLFPGIRIEL